ncbi:MAG TPA: CRISPR-associated endonuclease Cas2 [Phycisphaerae bacterium]|nr:CRISPR-associated endonuclease Cas2 [Phycisphaerae bacterium]
MLVTFCYDIPNDRRRCHVARLLDGVGRRVQYSVFEGDLDDKTLANVIERVKRVIHPTEDSVRVYRICATCKKQTVLLGIGELTEKPEVIIL